MNAFSEISNRDVPEGHQYKLWDRDVSCCWETGQMCVPWCRVELVLYQPYNHNDKMKYSLIEKWTSQGNAIESFTTNFVSADLNRSWKPKRPKATFVPQTYLKIKTSKSELVLIIYTTICIYIIFISCWFLNYPQYKNCCNKKFWLTLVRPWYVDFG